METRSINCDYCDKSFDAPKVGRARLYCSSRCATQAANQRRREAYETERETSGPIIVNCTICHNAFETKVNNPNPKRYCSKKCKNKAERDRVKAKGMCTRCGVRQRDSGFLSCFVCRDVEKEKRDARMAIECEACGKTFIPHKTGPEKYCSNTCCYHVTKMRKRWLGKHGTMDGFTVKDHQRATDDAIENIMKDWTPLAPEDSAVRKSCNPRELYRQGVGVKQQVRQWLCARKGGEYDPYTHAGSRI